MRSIHFSRGDFAQSFATRASIKQYQPGFAFSSPGYEPEPRSLWACWPESDEFSAELPQLLIVPDSEVEDFMAWSATFLSALRPLTAFMRVIPWRLFRSVSDNSPESVRLGAPLIGMILGETMMHMEGRRTLDTLPIAAFESTYSATMGKCFIRGFDEELLDHAERNWFRTRDLTNQPIRRGDTDGLREMLAGIVRIVNRHRFYRSVSPRFELIAEGCEEIRTSGELSHYSWQRLSRGRFPSSDLAFSTGASRERRVLAFEETAQALVRDSDDHLHASFLLGYLASRISEGSLEHSNLLLPLQAELPLVMPWYGFCSALLPATRVLTDYGYLGTKLMRQLMNREESLSPPTCDIAVDELEVLMRGDHGMRSFRQANPGFLRVEVAPTINTVVKWPTKLGSPSQLTLFQAEETLSPPADNGLRKLVAALQASLGIAEQLLAEETEASPRKPYKKSKRR